jgi:hypothetical protein
MGDPRLFDSGQNTTNVTLYQLARYNKWNGFPNMKNRDICPCFLLLTLVIIPAIYAIWKGRDLTQRE